MVHLSDGVNVPLPAAVMATTSEQQQQQHWQQQQQHSCTDSSPLFSPFVLAADNGKLTAAASFLLNPIHLF